MEFQHSSSELDFSFHLFGVTVEQLWLVSVKVDVVLDLNQSETV